MTDNVIKLVNAKEINLDKNLIDLATVVNELTALALALDTVNRRMKDGVYGDKIDVKDAVYILDTAYDKLEIAHDTTCDVGQSLTDFKNKNGL